MKATLIMMATIASAGILTRSPAGAHGRDMSGAYVLVSEGEVSVERRGASPSLAAEVSTLGDLDVVRTGPAGRATIQREAMWTVGLEPGSSGRPRSLPEPTPRGTDFRRAFELSSGAAVWTAAGDSVLAVGPLRIRARAARIRVSYRGEMVIEVKEGHANVETVDEVTRVTMLTGQVLEISFVPSLPAFKFDVIADNGQPLKIDVGTTTIQVTIGDVFTARVIGRNLEVVVEKGAVSVTHANGRTVQVSPTAPYTAPDGGIGAMQRSPGVRLSPAAGVSGYLREPRVDPFRDRADISPSGSP